MAKTLALDGIGGVYAEKLQNAAVRSTAELLEKGATPQGRREMAGKSGISESLILRWVNLADLYRINGISKRYAELLEAVGVDSVPELAQRNSENLHRHLLEAELERNLVRKLPNPSQVSAWIKQARKLPRVVQY